MTTTNVAQELQETDKVYVPTNEFPDANHIKFEMFYELGGMNYFSGRGERRGYYLSVTPVSRTPQEHNGHKYFTESFGIFRGTKIFLNEEEVARKSKKAEQEARKKITDQLIDELINYIKEHK